jgi:transposase
MLGEKQRDFKIQRAVSLDELVPEENFYRQLESKLDLSFVRDLVRGYYAAGLGRPSVDPVVFFKLQLIMFFEGFRSERQLMEQVHLNLAMRWYLGYDLDEEVPNHSTLSKIRDRLGLVVFQRFFEQIVQLCINAGLVWGQELHFDGTLVEASATMTGRCRASSLRLKRISKRSFSNQQQLSPRPIVTLSTNMTASKGK